MSVSPFFKKFRVSCPYLCPIFLEIPCHVSVSVSVSKSVLHSLWLASSHTWLVYTSWWQAGSYRQELEIFRTCAVLIHHLCVLTSRIPFPSLSNGAGGVDIGRCVKRLPGARKNKPVLFLFSWLPHTCSVSLLRSVLLTVDCHPIPPQSVTTFKPIVFRWKTQREKPPNNKSNLAFIDRQFHRVNFIFLLSKSKLERGTSRMGNADEHKKAHQQKEGKKNTSIQSKVGHYNTSTSTYSFSLRVITNPLQIN